MERRVSRQSTFDAIAAAKVAGGSSSGDDPATALRHYVNMRIVEVVARKDGIVGLVVGPVGHMSRRRLLIIGATDVRDVTDFRDSALADLDAHQDDIGDEMAERERYSERDIDITPEAPDHRPRPW